MGLAAKPLRDTCQTTRVQLALRTVAASNLQDVYESMYWSKKFGALSERLKEAVRAVGMSASAVDGDCGVPCKGRNFEEGVL